MTWPSLTSIGCNAIFFMNFRIFVRIRTIDWWYGWELNGDKCKDMVIDFSKSKQPFDPIGLGSLELELVGFAKVLGLTLGEAYLELPRRKDHHKGKQADVFYYPTKTGRHSRG